MPSPDAISVRNLVVTFGEGARLNRAVDGISFTVPEGGSFGLVGESGSGKSTVLRAIAGLAPVAEGEIAIRGKVLGKGRDLEFFRTVQMVFQDPYASLHPRHTVDRTLSEPLRMHGLDRIELMGPLIVDERLLELALIGQRRGQTEVPAPIVLLDRDRSPQHPDAFF